MSGRCIFGGLLATLLTLSGAAAADVRDNLFAELVVGSERQAPARPSGARTNREQAGGYARDASPAPLVVESDGEDEAGVLAPRGGAPSEERAYEGRSRARAYQSPGGGVPGQQLVPQGLPGSIGEVMPGGAGELRGRARAHVGSGNARDIDLSHVGRDGIPIVSCQDVDNVSGRIGDDSSAGAIVLLIRQGRQIKVRCR